MSTSTKKLMILLLIPLSTAEGCIRATKPSKSIKKYKEIPSLPVNSKNTRKGIPKNRTADPAQLPLQRSSLQDVLPSKQDVQKQKDSIASDTKIDRTIDEKKEHAKGNVEGEDKDHNQRKQSTETPKQKGRMEWLWKFWPKGKN